MALSMEVLQKQFLELLDRFRVIEDILIKLKDKGDPPPFDMGRYTARASMDPLTEKRVNPVVDPAPYDWWWRCRFCWWRRNPWIDPAPPDYAREDIISTREFEKKRWQKPIPYDPVPPDLFRIPIVDLIGKFRVVDKAVLANLGDLRLIDVIEGIFPGGDDVDPVPDDLGRLSKVELESVHHRINSKLIRLKSLEKKVAEMTKAGAKTKARAKAKKR
jgi:hypothetical protein